MYVRDVPDFSGIISRYAGVVPWKNCLCLLEYLGVSASVYVRVRLVVIIRASLPVFILHRRRVEI